MAIRLQSESYFWIGTPEELAERLHNELGWELSEIKIPEDTKYLQLSSFYDGNLKTSVYDRYGNPIHAIVVYYDHDMKQLDYVRL